MPGGGTAWFYDAYPNDNTIQNAESMGFTTWNDAGIIGRTMRFSMDGIRTMEGEDPPRLGRRVVEGRVGPGRAAVWEPGELHETRSPAGLSAMIVEGDLDIGAPGEQVDPGDT